VPQREVHARGEHTKHVHHCPPFGPRRPSTWLPSGRDCPLHVFQPLVPPLLDDTTQGDKGGPRSVLPLEGWVVQAVRTIRFPTDLVPGHASTPAEAGVV